MFAFAPIVFAAWALGISSVYTEETAYQEVDVAAFVEEEAAISSQNTDSYTHVAMTDILTPQD